jgi:hypothetical protein
VIDRPHGFTTEYQTADLLLKIARNDIPIADSSINYNVDEDLGFTLPLPKVPAKGDSAATVASKAAEYMKLSPVSLYWALPFFDTDPNKAHLSVPTDGTPPNFGQLRTAVETVLAADPTGTVDLTKLTVEQCRNIAYEIVWNRILLPLPVPPKAKDPVEQQFALEVLYTKPASDDDDRTKRRQQFESDLTKYYVTNDGQADVLTKYVYALSAALACQSVSGPPQLDKSINDPITTFLSNFTAGFKFGQTPSLDPASPAFTNAVAAVFPNDTRAQAWLTQTLLAIDTLYFVSDVATDDATHFSIAEALYARGFADKATITALSPQDFADALIGTIANLYASQIQAKAGGSTAPTTPGTGTFQPINPDGTLTNCIPPTYLSPFGPVAYLHALLNVSTAATCDNPQPTAPPNSQLAPTIGALVSSRRGPLGNLSVTRANLQAPLPMIDLVIRAQLPRRALSAVRVRGRSQPLALGASARK